jgi:hypothetical protein
MRIEFLTQADPAYLLPFFDKLFGHADRDIKIVRVSCCRTIGSRPSTQLAMYHGEKPVGLAIHYMTEKVDEGQALLQESLRVREGKPLDHLIRRSKRQAAHRLTTYQEIRKFRRRGLRVI